MKDLKELFIKIDLGNKKDNLRAAYNYLSNNKVIYGDNKCYMYEDNGYIMYPTAKAYKTLRRDFITYENYGSSAVKFNLKGAFYILKDAFKSDDLSFYILKNGFKESNLYYLNRLIKAFEILKFDDGSLTPLSIIQKQLLSNKNDMLKLELLTSCSLKGFNGCNLEYLTESSAVFNFEKVSILKYKRLEIDLDTHAASFIN